MRVPSCYVPEQKIEFKGGVMLPHTLRVTGTIAWKDPVFIDDYKFVATHVSKAIAKQTIPSPSVLHFRGGRKAIDHAIYPDLDGFFADLGTAYHDAIAGLRRRRLPLSATRRGRTSPISAIPSRSPR